MDIRGIRSVTIDYEGLDELVGRNPESPLREEHVVDVLRDALREGRSFYVRGGTGPESRTFELSLDTEQGGYWFSESANR